MSNMSPHKRHSSSPLGFLNRPTVRQVVDRISSGEYNTSYSASGFRLEAASTSLKPTEQPLLDPQATNRRSQYDLRDSVSSSLCKIPITQSILNAYAKMHGHTDDNGGPLWNSLYMMDDPNYIPGNTPGLVPEEWAQPTLRNQYSQDGEMNVFKIPRGKMLYFDLAKSSTKLLRHKQPPLIEADIKAAARRLKPQPSTLGFELLYRQGWSPPRFKPNHYKGDQGFANYGYLYLNGTWVDPDSQIEVSDALMGYSSPTTPPLPTSSGIGPRIMIQEEEEDQYSSFVDYVSDDEGDPRDHRINSEVFSNWAVNAQRGSSYVVETVVPEILHFVLRGKSQSRRHSNAKPKTPPKIHPQFDIKTGSPISGYYEVDQNPSPLYSPQGVDMFRRPGTKFIHNNPQANLDMWKAAYGQPKSSQAKLSSLSTGSDRIQTLNSEAAERALADDEDIQTGVNRFNSYREHINRIHLERAYILDLYVDKMADLNQLIEEKKGLEKDVFFLRRKESRFTEKARQAECAKQRSEEVQRRLHLRQLKEGAERLTQDTRWAIAMMEKADMEWGKTENEIAELEEEKRRLLEKMGAQHMDRLPDVVPQRMSSKSSTSDE